MVGIYFANLCYLTAYVCARADELAFAGAHDACIWNDICLEQTTFSGVNNPDGR